MRRFSAVIILLCLIIGTLVIPDFKSRNSKTGISDNSKKSGQNLSVRAISADQNTNTCSFGLSQEPVGSTPDSKQTPVNTAAAAATANQKQAPASTAAVATDLTQALANTATALKQALANTATALKQAQATTAPAPTQTPTTTARAPKRAPTTTAAAPTQTPTTTAPAPKPPSGDAVENPTLTITETVKGHYGNRTKDFIFRVFITDRNNNALSAGTKLECTVSGAGIETPVNGTLKIDNDGKCGFMLKHSQSITIQGIALDYKIRIVEDITSSDYDVSFIDSEKSIVETGNDTGGKTGALRQMTTNRAFHFTGERPDVTPTGIYSGDIRAIFPLVALILLTSLTTLTYNAVLGKHEDGPATFHG